MAQISGMAAGILNADLAHTALVKGFYLRPHVIHTPKAIDLLHARFTHMVDLALFGLVLQRSCGLWCS